MTTRICGRGSLTPRMLSALLVIAWFASTAVSARAFPFFCGGPGQPPCFPFSICLIDPNLQGCNCNKPGSPPCASTLLDTYYNTSAGDNSVRLITPVGTGSTNVCAMIYVFDAKEEMGACCGCPLSPQRLLSLSVENDLTGNWALFPRSSTGIIDVVAAPPNVAVVSTSGLTNGQGCPSTQGLACNSGCDPTNLPGYLAGGELKGYIVHNTVPGIPEVPFAEAGDPDTNTLNYLQEQCTAVIGNDTSGGICDCGP